MPELPEVTTVVKFLKETILNKTIKDVDIYYRNLIKSDYSIFTSDIKNRTILDIRRVGKFIKFILDDDLVLICHLRMEGKFYYFKDLESYEKVKSDSMLITFTDNTYLVYNDSRKFGVMALESSNQHPSLLDNVAKDPLDIDISPDSEDIENIYKKMQRCSKTIKEFITSQDIISGIGNIYADEILFKSKISPFIKSSLVSKEDLINILINSKEILKLAIEHNGSTVSTYHPALGVSGSFQDFLNVYSHENEKCKVCGTVINKRFIKGRGTSFCRKCQNIKPSFALTGPIACGKSTFLNLLKELYPSEIKILSLDELVSTMYKTESFIHEVSKKFSSLVKENKNKLEIDKKVLQQKLVESAKFKQEYQNFLYPKLKDKVNNFLNENYNYITVIEIPNLFESRMINLFTYTMVILSDKEKSYENLVNRNEKDPETKLKLNSNVSNSIKKHLKDFDIVILNNGNLEDLKNEVISFYNKFKDC